MGTVSLLMSPFLPVQARGFGGRVWLRARLSRRVGAGFHDSGRGGDACRDGKFAGQPGVGGASSRARASVITSVQGQCRVSRSCVALRW
jgi:hypothetical protein